MSTSSVNAPGGSLGKNAFLQLMVTQMQYQDPLQPQDNSQFIAQLAQFTSLEQMTNIAQSNQQLLQINQLNFEHQLLNTSVTVTDSKNNPVTGTVTGIQIINGEPNIVVQGQPYPMSALSQIGGTSSAG
jgi:flagellar basal-body rod modification protein FlgD